MQTRIELKADSPDKLGRVVTVDSDPEQLVILDVSGNPHGQGVWLTPTEARAIGFALADAAAEAEKDEER